MCSQKCNPAGGNFVVALQLRHQVCAKSRSHTDLIIGVVVKGGKAVLSAVGFKPAGKQEDPRVGDVLAHSAVCKILSTSQPVHKAALLWLAAIRNLLDLHATCPAGAGTSTQHAHARPVGCQ